MKSFKQFVSENRSLIALSPEDLRSGNYPYKRSKRQEDLGELSRKSRTQSRSIPRQRMTDDSDPTEKLTPEREIKRQIGSGFQKVKGVSKDMTDLDLIRLYRSSNKNKLRKMITDRGGNPEQVSGFIDALKLKRKIKLTEKIDYGDPTLPPSFPDVIKGGQELGTYSGAVAGLDPVTFPVINYRSAALTPGAQSGQNDPFVSGGQGWKIDKNSKDFFTKIAKMYGVNSFDSSNKLKELQSKEAENKSQTNQERLVFNYITDPMMSELIRGEKSKELIKAATEMQSWKADFQNPLKRLNSWYPSSVDSLLSKTQRENHYKDLQNLSKIGNILRQRIMSTDIHSKLNDLKLSPVDNDHIRDHTDPIEIKMNIVDKMLADYDQEDSETKENEGDSYESPSSNLDMNFNSDQ